MVLVAKVEENDHEIPVEKKRPISPKSRSNAWPAASFTAKSGATPSAGTVVLLCSMRYRAAALSLLTCRRKSFPEEAFTTPEAAACAAYVVGDHAESVVGTTETSPFPARVEQATFKVATVRKERLMDLTLEIVVLSVKGA